MLRLVKLLLWMAFTGVMAFVFLVLLDYGPGRFPEGIRKESARVWGAVQRRMDGVAGRRGRTSDAQGAPARTQTR